MKRFALLAFILIYSPVYAATFILVYSPVYAATYAITVTGTTTINGMSIDGGGVYAGMTISNGSALTASHMSIGHVADDAINIAESASISDSAVWCGADADCTITVATGKTLTGATNAVRVAPGGDGTNSWTGTIELTECPYVSCSTWDLRAKKDSPLLNSATNSLTDSRGRAGDDIGAWQHMRGMMPLEDVVIPVHRP